METSTREMNASARQLNNNYKVELEEKQIRLKIKNSLVWGTCNLFLVAVLAYDIIHTTASYYALILYVEYGLFFTFLLNSLYHSIIYLKESAKIAEPSIQLRIKQSPEIRQEPETFNCTFLSNSMNRLPYDNSPTKLLSSTPVNSSWASNLSSLSEKLQQSTSPSKFNTSAKTYHDSSQTEYFIKDEASLSEYLKGYENSEKNSRSNSPMAQASNVLSTFWNHPAAVKNAEVPVTLQRCNYQLSSPSPSDLNNQSNSKSTRRNNQLGIEMWKQLNVNHATLTQWNANIRLWFSQSILECLSNQFAEIDSALQKYGLTDIQVGCVGLERLRRTSQMALVLQYIPTLSILIPFLEVCSNQSYLVKRIRELATGGCMSNFKWNSGSWFNGKEWDESLPTDSEILMHLFATYMDTQLPPLPSCPDLKPFSGCYYIKLNQEISPSRKIAIQCTSTEPPYFRVLIGSEVFEMVQGYNNLFHTILFFLYQVDKKDYGMLGGINLGKSGINMLWVINK